MARFLSPLRASAYIVVALSTATGFMPGCVEHVLQTANTETDYVLASGGSLGLGGANAALISCHETTTSDEISFGSLPGLDDDLSDSPLVALTYGALEGPGLYVAARDVFRVYLNGELVLMSEEARTPSFVPLTLPPGDNVLAVAVAAESGPPAALLHLSELAGEYGSDGSWRMSASPSEGWMNVDFDDGNWTSAVELGDRGEVPGCDPQANFPNMSSARWIGASASAKGTLALRRHISIAPVGFGAETTGGYGTAPVVVTTFAELETAVDNDEPAVIVLPEGVYDFRTEPRDQEVCPIPCVGESGKVQHQVLIDTTCAEPLVTLTRNDQKLGLGSNKTILGAGRGALLRGLTMDFQESTNIIVRNIALFDVNPHLLEAGDAFSLNQPSRVWIDHGTVKWVSDGFTDLRAGTRDITVSYMRYDGAMEEFCGNRHGLPSEVTDATLTMHHSRFDNVSTRAPFVTGSNARVHLFNNVYSGVGGWAVGARCLAQVLLEGNTFEDVDAVTYRSECDMPPDMGLILAPLASNLYRDDSNVHLGGDSSEPHDSVFEPAYDYPLQAASEAWPVVISRAGTGGPWALPLTRD